MAAPGLRMTEAEFLGWITDTADRLGWRSYHLEMPARHAAGGRIIPDARGKGLPDLFLIHRDPPRLIMAEVKGPDTPISDDQREFWHSTLDVRHAIEALLEDVARDALLPPTYVLPISPFGSYVWRQGRDEAMIETILRSKVLVK